MEKHLLFIIQVTKQKENFMKIKEMESLVWGIRMVKKLKYSGKTVKFMEKEEIGTVTVH